MPRHRRFARPRSRQPLTIATHNGPLELLLVRSPRRRTIEISVGENARVQVSAPTYSALKDIEAFILHKSSWIAKRVTEAKRRQAVLDRRLYEDGEQFLFLGRRYGLTVVPGEVRQPRLTFSPEGWEMVVPAAAPPEERRRLTRKKLVDWYRRQAKEVLGGRIFTHARRMKLAPKKIMIRTQKRIWGSCGYRDQSISLNWLLILAPLEVIDYVVVHELCHLRVPNHSARFWRQVEEALPDFKSRQAWLKQHTVEMALPAREEDA